LTRQEYHSAVKEFSSRLHRYVFKCLRDTEDARDIVQDTFTKLWENRKAVEWGKSKAWLFTTAHNGLINFLKKQGRTSFYEEEKLDRMNPVSESHRFEVKEILDKCLEALPPIQKSILLLRDLEGYDYKEIGEILDLTESQVKVYLFRGRQKLKDNLKDLTILA
jgi:RNA polymerase sigma factor (sigma-70 family)